MNKGLAWLVVSLCSAACRAHQSDDDPNIDTDAASSDGADTDRADTDRADTDLGSDTDVDVKPDNPSGLTECPATLPPDTICADIENYGVAMFPLIQAAANVISGTTDEPDGHRDGVSLQLKGTPQGQLYAGEANCNSDDGPVGVYVYLSALDGTRWEWDEESPLASCTQNLVTLGQMSLESSGTFTSVLVRMNGSGPETITATGSFRVHGEAAAAR